VITITRGGDVVDINPGAERMFGVSPEAVRHKPIAELLAAAPVREVDLTELSTVLSQDPARLLDRELELTASRDDGRSFAAELLVARAGCLFVVWIRDVSARRVAETEVDGRPRARQLTARERQMLQLAAQGMSRKAIARHLSLSQSTVKTHFQNIYTKWGISDRASAVAKALRERIIE
jgi:PAS domain S-box-containing protein